MKKVGYLGAGAWGFCLANLLAGKKYPVVCWTTNVQLAKQLNETGEHPIFPGFRTKGNIRFTTNLSEAIDGAELLVESVTSAGLRPVFQQVKQIGTPNCPIVITSKGIEQGTGLILPDVVVEVLGEETRSRVGFLSGPSFAQEVIRGLPTSVVGTAFDPHIMKKICEYFTSRRFRVYPNKDIYGVAFGGGLKNIVAIACGIAHGLSLGSSCTAALMTRGLHEIRKIATAKGCKLETLYGLSGMGDLCLTCGSQMSRNFRFGVLIAQGLTPGQAHDQIGMVVEGAYTCVSALQLSKQLGVQMPITEAVYGILHNKITPSDAVIALMQRTIKEEHL